MDNILLFGNLSSNTDFEAEIKRLESLIQLIDSNVKFNISAFWGILGIIIAGIALFSWLGIKKGIENQMYKYIDEKFKEAKLLSERCKIISGTKYFRKDELIDGQCKIPIGKKVLNISFTRPYNKVEIQPIEGQEELEYSAYVENGTLYIEFINFNREAHKGISWEIMYIE